jgi:hypothetical protein
VKGVLLAAAVTGLYVVVLTVIFRTLNIKRRAAAMIRLFIVGAAVLVFVFAATPSNLGFLPQSLVAAQAWADLSVGLLVYCACVLGGVLQVYNLAERGFSLRILIDIDESTRQQLTVGEIARGYAAGQGIEWMYSKRIDDAYTQRLVRLDDGTVHLLTRGKRIARACRWLRAVYGLA